MHDRLYLRPPTFHHPLEPQRALPHTSLELLRHFRAKHAPAASNLLCTRPRCLFVDEDPDLMQGHCESHEYYDARAEHDSEGRFLARCDICETSEIFLEKHRALKWHQNMSFFSRIRPVPSILRSLGSRASHLEESPASTTTSQNGNQQHVNDQPHKTRSLQTTVDSTYSYRLQRTGTASYAPSFLQPPNEAQLSRCKPIKAGRLGKSFRYNPLAAPTVMCRSRSVPVGGAARHRILRSCPGRQ